MDEAQPEPTAKAAVTRRRKNHREWPLHFKTRWGRVSIYQIHGTAEGEYYQVQWYVGERRFRATRRDVDDAIAKAQEVIAELKRGHQKKVELSDEQVYRYLALEERLESAGTTLEEVFDFYEKNFHPIEKTRWFVAVEKYVENLKARDMSPAYVTIQKARLDAFDSKGDFGHYWVDEIQNWQFKMIINHRDFVPVTQRQMRGTLVAFLKWARENRIIRPDVDPAAGLGTDFIKIKAKDPEIIVAEDARELLALILKHNPTVLPNVVLGLFGGLRSVETQRLRWGDLRFDQKEIHLSSAVTKTNRRRVVTMRPCLEQWLKVSMALQDQVYLRENDRITGYKMIQNPIKKITGGKDSPFRDNPLPRNCFRKSFVSHACAAGDKDLLELAQECGHSVEVLSTIYRSLVTRGQADEWFSIFPPEEILDRFPLPRIIPHGSTKETPRPCEAESVSGEDCP